MGKKELTKEELELKTKAQSLTSALKVLLNDSLMSYGSYRELITPLLNNYRFDITNHISDYDTNRIMTEKGYASRYQLEEEIEEEMRKDMEAKDLNEVFVNELLAQVKTKYDYLPHLEKALGAKLVAEVRGEEYVGDELTAEETVNDANPNCYCSKVVDAEAYEIDECCRMNAKQSSQQWVGHNSKGEFYVETCSCGMISKPYLADK